MVRQVLLFSLSISLSMGKDLGNFATTFAIAEQDLITVIQAKLVSLQESGKLQGHQDKIKERLQSKLATPAPVQGIQHTTKLRVFSFDPTITLAFDVKDHTGKVLHYQGERINPLDYQTLTHPLLLIDGTASQQVEWALKNKLKGKIILVKGQPFALMNALNIAIYFDQAGKITNKLGIHHVPAIVVQKGKVLQVREEVVDGP